MSLHIDLINNYKKEIDSITFKVLQKTITHNQLIEQLDKISKDMSSTITAYNNIHQTKTKYFTPYPVKTQMSFLPKMRNYSDSTITPSCSIDDNYDARDIMTDETQLIGSLKDSPVVAMSSPLLSYHISQSPKMTFML